MKNKILPLIHISLPLVILVLSFQNCANDVEFNTPLRTSLLVEDTPTHNQSLSLKQTQFVITEGEDLELEINYLNPLQKDRSVKIVLEELQQDILTRTFSTDLKKGEQSTKVRIQSLDDSIVEPVESMTLRVYDSDVPEKFLVVEITIMDNDTPAPGGCLAATNEITGEGEFSWSHRQTCFYLKDKETVRCTGAGPCGSPTYTPKGFESGVKAFDGHLSGFCGIIEDSSRGINQPEVHCWGGANNFYVSLGLTIFVPMIPQVIENLQPDSYEISVGGGEVCVRSQGQLSCMGMAEGRTIFKDSPAVIPILLKDHFDVDTEAYCTWDHGEEKTCYATNSRLAWASFRNKVSVLPGFESGTTASDEYDQIRCGITDGNIVCLNSRMSQPYPEESGEFVRISVGYYRVCGMGSSGKVWCWGPNGGPWTQDFDGPSNRNSFLGPDGNLVTSGPFVRFFPYEWTPPPEFKAKNMVMAMGRFCFQNEEDNKIYCRRGGNSGSDHYDPLPFYRDQVQ